MTDTPSGRILGFLKSPARAVKPPVSRRRAKISQGDVITRAELDVRNAKTMSEDVWRQHYRGIAAEYGFHLRYHTYRSDRSDPGWPDDVLYQSGTARMLLIEAKRQRGDLTTDQVAWLDAWAKVRDRGAKLIEVYGPVRPLDQPGLITVLARGTVYQTGVPELHQWCLDPYCERCTTERSKAKPPTPKAARKARRVKARGQS